MGHGIVYSNKDALYLSKKHFCPNCQAELTKIEVSKTINSNSEEAKKMPKMFSRTVVGYGGIKFRRFNFAGDIKCICKEFQCQNCNLQFTIEEMKRIESVATSEPYRHSPEETKKIKRKKLIFNKIIPFGILALIAIIHYFVTK